MSDRFAYPGDNSIIIQDGSIIWNDQSHDHSSLQYMDANDTIISDSSMNETYATATDSSETQYFSILEHSNDITLEDLHNLTVENSEVQGNIVLAEDVSPSMDEEIPQENKDEDDSSQVVVFTLDGSNDLYGIQFTQDEQGNIQKYQFKFRTTAEGQLEAIPETVQLLSNDDQAAVETESKQSEIEPIGELQATQPNQYFLVQTEDNSQSVNSNNMDQEQQQVDVSKINISRGHVLIKGEEQSAAVLETSIETQNLNREAQHDCTGFDQQEDLTEEMGPGFISIKTEIVERTVQEEHHELHSSANIKQEHYTEELSDCHEEFDETIQPEPDNFEESEQIHHVKEQPQETLSEEEIENDQNDITIREPIENFKQNIDEDSQAELGNPVQNRPNHEELLEQFLQENCQIEVEYDPASEEQERSPQEYQIYNVEESQNDNNYLEEPDLDADHNSDGEQYEIVEGLHVTGEPQEQVAAEADSEPVLHEVIERYQEQNIERTNILKHPVTNSNKNLKPKKPFVSVKYYVVYPEKENVNSLADNTISQLPLPKLTRPNPRSVLRTSYMKSKESGHYEKKATDSFPDSDLFHKRFAKNKDAMRAKLFHNFLNRTTIPHAPVRQQRQPRKQEIKPVIERSDEEIIVQEVMISSDGFIESLNKKMKNKLQVTAVVELSDSEEEESNTRINRNRRKTHHIPRQISESELSVIEIHSDEETNLSKKDNLEVIVKRGKGRPKKSNIESETATLKRRRGRPPKNKKCEVPRDCELFSSEPTPSQEVEIVKGSTVDKSEINIEKEEIACPKCPKTFPSKNSLNTHIYHHNLESRLKNKAMSSQPTLKLRQSTMTKIEYTHKCQSCQQTFKNSILLQKHNCPQKQNLLNCSVCLKQFRDVTLLNIHKKSHIKSNLVSNTSIAKVSPKKSLLRPSTSLIKTPKTKSLKTVATNVFRCKQCPKICDSEQSLTAHTKMHQKFLCPSCSATFSSRLLLDTHIRTNCVKVKSPTNKRLSFKIRKSFIHTPPKRVSSYKVPNTSCHKTLNQSVASLQLECEVCKMKFSTFRNLYTHKVQKHGLNTPDKSLLSKPKQTIYKPRAAHGGIPANDRMKKAYAALRQKLAEMQDKSNVAQ